MPYIDFNKTPLSNLAAPFDFTIIGAGVAGILLAVKLSERHKRVVVIESGHFEEDESRQALNRVEQTGKIVENAIDGRKRAVGGTSIAWGGQSLPFTQLDFDVKDWVQNSGWDINLSDLMPYYPIANRFMNIDEWDYRDDIYKRLKYEKINTDESHIYQHFSKWSPTPNLWKLYDAQLRQHVTVIYNAQLTKINLNTEGLANEIEISNFNKEQSILPVKNLLIATGGIETNRILLANNHQVKGGIGNHSGWLGKGFMDHPCIEIGEINHPNRYKLQSIFNTHIYQKRKYSVRLSLTEAAQKKYQLMNTSALVEFREYENPKDNPYTELFNFRDVRRLVAVGKILKNLDSYFLTAKALLTEGFIYKHKALPRINLMLEQEPTEDSYIGLSNEKDQFGVPKAKIHWQITDKTWHTVNTMSTFLKNEFKRLSLGELKIYPHIHLDNPNWANYLTDANHHMGGTRMSATPDKGVVDNQLRVWGHDNIYVCSSSVFPTGSHSNPTLTMMALCARLVDFVCQES